MDEVHNSHNPLHNHQKAGFLLLLLFGILAVGLGVLQMRNTIYGPFAYKAPERTGQTTNDLLENETVRLQSIDTDQDGLNDYEELYFYQTSPYLPDTDSDGINDKQELDAGNDPLCPAGQNCDSASQLSPENVSSTAPGGTGITVQSPEQILGQINTGIEQGQEADLSNLVENPDAIRELIAQTGKVSREQLDSLDDQTLLNLVVQIMAEQDGTAAGDPAIQQESSSSATSSVFVE